MSEGRNAVANLTRRWTWVLVALAAIGTHRAQAEDRFEAPTLLAQARVIWTHADRVYIACSDSTAVVHMGVGPYAAKLTFTDKRDTLAIGYVTAIDQNELIVAVLTSGSLQKAKRLDRIKVLAQFPTIFRNVPPRTLIRVGYPGPERLHPLFECADIQPDTTLLGDAYRLERPGPQDYRLIPTAALDTLLVRFFNEVADEEIALERGDIDVAVFWPGEASTHIREAMGWTSYSSGRRSGIFLTATSARPDSSVPSGAWFFRNESLALGMLNREVFRGDLYLLHAPLYGSLSPRQPGGRFEVMAGIPGRDRIQRYMDGITAASGDSAVGVVRLEVMRTPDHEPSPAEVERRWWFALRCPVISSRSKGATTLNLDFLVNLFTCSSSGTKP
jgi:hypothetical protein